MKKLSEKTNKILMAVFAVCTLVMHAALSRAFVYGLLVEALVHVGFFLLFFAFFVVFAHHILSVRLPKTALIVMTTVYVVTYTVMMILLIGFQKYIPALAVGIVYVAAPFWFFFEKTEKKKSAICLSLALVVLFAVTVPGYFRHLFYAAWRENNVELYLSEEKGYFVHGKQPTKIYRYTTEPTTTADVLFHNSLQAYAARHFTDQIIYDSGRESAEGYTALHIETIEKYYPNVQIEEVAAQKELLDKYADRITGYILYDDGDREELFVAANLCYQMNAVMVGKSIKSLADEYGWKMVFDTAGWNEKKFLESEYFSKLDNHIMILMDSAEHNRPSYGQDTIMSEFWDLGMMNNSWFVYNDDISLVDLEKRLSKLKRNSLCIGSLDGKAENAVVAACARYSTTFVYTRYTANMSVLSGFDLKKATTETAALSNGKLKKAEPCVYSADNVPKHTVCVMLSDGDNVRFCSESLMSECYYRSPLRDDKLQYNCGLAGSMAEVAPIFLLEFYDWMCPTDDFAYQLSSVGYTYPSKWTDKKAWDQVVGTLARVMKETETSVVEIMDDNSFMGVLDVPSDFSAMKPYFDTFTEREEIDGCLFIGYTALYSGYRGAVCWSNDKPIVSAKYSVWYDEGTPFNSERNTIEYIVKEINAAPTDKTKEDSYTFIIVHGWSGLNEDGELVGLSLGKKGVDNTAIFKKLQDSFDEDVEMVSTTEFINRMRRNVKR